MKSAIARQFYKTLSLLLTGLILAVCMVIGQVAYVLPVQAATLTPEATQYQVDRRDDQTQASDGMAGGMMQSLKETAETVKEKLNLDEPLPEGTKLFLKQVQGEDVEVKEPRPFMKGQTPMNE